MLCDNAYVLGADRKGVWSAQPERQLPDHFNSVKFNDRHGYNLIREVYHYQAASCSMCSLNLQYVDST